MFSRRNKQKGTTWISCRFDPFLWNKRRFKFEKKCKSCFSRLYKNRLMKVSPEILASMTRKIRIRGRSLWSLINNVNITWHRSQSCETFKGHVTLINVTWHTSKTLFYFLTLCRSWHAQNSVSTDGVFSHLHSSSDQCTIIVPLTLYGHVGHLRAAWPCQVRGGVNE